MRCEAAFFEKYSASLSKAPHRIQESWNSEPKNIDIYRDYFESHIFGIEVVDDTLARYAANVR